MDFLRRPSPHVYFVVLGATTTSIVQSSPVPQRAIAVGG